MTKAKRITDADQRLGQRIRSRRLEMGVSQMQLADMLGVTFQQIQKYEKGKNRVAASRLQQIAEHLKTNIAHFIDTNGKIVENTPIGSFIATRRGMSLCKAAMVLDNHRLDSVIQLARSLGRSRSNSKSTGAST